jgi:hypothetical protein
VFQMIPSMAYESTSKFVVTVKDKGRDNGRFVFRRSGLDWKLTEIILPPKP